MRHPVEVFDNDQLRLMSQSFNAAIETVRLTGTEPTYKIQLEMAKRLMREASQGIPTRLSLTEAALDGTWC